MTIRILTGDCMARLAEMPEASVQCVVTSPPYFGLRDYGQDGQIGLEETPAAYIDKLVSVFREVHRVLRDDGTVWLNLGDSYAANGERQTGRNDTERETPGGRGGSFRGGTRKAYRVSDQAKAKDLYMIPARVALSLQADGWYLRSDIIWSKPNPMPESVTDRPTSAHEHVFLLTKSARYFYDSEAVKEAASETSGWAKQRAKGVNTWKYNDTEERKAQTGQQIHSSTFGTEGLRNLRNVWEISSQPYPGAHFAVFPPALAERCIKAGSREGDTILDPFGGAGTTGLVADRLGRHATLIELSPDYAEQARGRIAAEAGIFASVEVA